MSKDLYLVLTQTGSIWAQAIKVYTRDAYNHVSIALSPDLDPMFSFGRRQTYNPFWGGFVKERKNAGIYKRFPKTRCAVLRLSVSEEIYDSIKAVLYEMYEHKEIYGYDFIGLCLAAVKIEKQRNNKFYCSEFIRSIFRKFKVPGSEDLASFTAPSDFLNFKGAKVVYEGVLKDYSADL